MENFLLSGLIALLIGAVGFLSYTLGERTERNADFKEKEKTAAEIRRLRSSLDNPDVVDELHNRFKR